MKLRSCLAAGLLACGLVAAASAEEAAAAWPASLPVLPSLPDSPCRMPSWPDAVREKVQAQDAKVSVRVGKDGSVQGLRLDASSGFEIIDDAVLRALSRCRFQAARLKDQPIESVSALGFRWADQQLVRSPVPTGEPVRYFAVDEAGRAPQETAAAPAPAASQAPPKSGWLSGMVSKLTSALPSMFHKAEPAATAAGAGAAAASASAPAVSTVADLGRQCQPLEKALPALRRVRQGSMEMKLGYDPQGTIVSVDLTRGSGDASLDEDARRALLGCNAEQALGAGNRPALYTWEWQMK